jgi:hypothetical protein
MAGSCGHCNEHSTSIKGGIFIGQLRGYHLLKKDSVLYTRVVKYKPYSLY